MKKIIKTFDCIFGSKRAYFASLRAVCISVLWSLLFFLVAQLAVSFCIQPMITDLFTPVHLLFKAMLGENYNPILERYLYAIAAFASILSACRYGFKSTQTYRTHFSEFTDGFARAREGLVHHYKSYGVMDFVSCIVVTLFLMTAKKYFADILFLLPHFNILSMIFPSISQNTFLEFLCAALTLSLASVFGVYASQKSWRADLLYDLE